MYTYTPKNIVISSPTSLPAWIINDKPAELTTDELQEHFANIQALLIERIETLSDAGTVLNEDTEKELSFIFDVLLNAKHNLEL